jgi:cysteine desulfurase
VDVDDTGMVRAADVAAAIRPETILISIMHANNEVGTIQPIAEIAALAHQERHLYPHRCGPERGQN